MTRSQAIRCTGSAALDLCNLGCGRIDDFWELELNPWDTAAGAIIVREAGGTLTDFCGNSFSIGGEHILASNGSVDSELLTAIMEPGTLTGL